MSAIIETARYIVRARWPFLAPVVRALRPVPSPGMLARIGGPIGVTARGVLLYDPDAIGAWTAEQLAAILAGHEALHIANRHFERAAQYGAHLDMRRWNVAADCAINEVTAACLHAVGADWPVTPCRAAAFNLPTGETAEFYYEHLPKDAGRDQPEPTPGDPTPGDGSPTDCMGRPLPPEEAALDAEHGQGEEQVKRTVDKAREAIEKAPAGALPGGLKAMFPAPAPTRTPWQTIFRRALGTAARRSGMSDLTWARPSRLQPAVGYRAMLPAWIARVPRVACYVDTSGSMCSEATRASIGGELEGMLRALRVPVLVATCDVRIHGEVKAKSFAEAERLGVFDGGGGGTDFRPIFDHLRKLRASERPGIAVVMTDGYGPAPAAPPPGVRVLWLLVGGTGRPAKWGEYIEVKD